MAPKMASRRQRNQCAPVSAPVSAEQWFLQLPDGVCKAAMSSFLQEARSNGENCDTALAQCFAWAAQEFPEEIVLWGLSGGLGEVPWPNANFQRCVRASTLALRELRSQYVDLAMQRDALLTQMRAVGASEPIATFAPFVGTGHRVDKGLNSFD